MLYALEHMFWTEARWIKTPQRQPEQFVAALVQVYGRFLARREFLLHSMRRQIERRQDLEDLLPLFRKYEDQLDLLKEFLQYLDRHHAAFCAKARIANRAAAAQVLMSALDEGIQAVAEGDGENALGRRILLRLRSSFGEGARLVQGVVAEARRDLGDAVLPAFTQYLERREKLREQFKQDFKKWVKKMKARHPWRTTDFAIDPVEETTPQNPFLIAGGASAVLRENASVETLIAWARSCRCAAALVPSIPGKSNEINVTSAARAFFLGIGGTVANRAAAKDLGAARLPRARQSAPVAGKLAHSLWIEYRRNEPFASEVSDEVLQGFAMGCAYGGALEKADAVLYPNIVQAQVVVRGHLKTVQLQLRPFSQRSDFWRDCARIYSVLGNVELALLCLRAAHPGMGILEREAAKVSPDLQPVRLDPRTAAGFKQLFP